MKQFLLVTASVFAFSICADSASAQTAQAETGENESQTSGFKDIIVTARKKDERLMDVPVAVSAMSGEDIARYSTDGFAAIAQQTPQLVIGESQSATGGAINLRGIGAGTENPSTDQSVSINIDGVQISQANALRLGQYDLGRVEVLKGPQALFYGKNSPAGVISLISNDPGPDLEIQARAGYELKAKQRFIEAIVSGPISDNLGARLVAYYSKQDGWFRNIAIPVDGLTPGAANKFGPEQDEFFIRGTLAYASPDDALRLKLKLNYGKIDRDRVGITATSQQYFCPFGVPQLGGGITTDCERDRNYTTPAASAAQAAMDPSFGDGTPNYHSKQFLGALSVDYDASDTLTISSVTGLYNIKQFYFDTYMGTNLPFIVASGALDIEQFTQELRFASHLDGPVNFLAGGFMQRSSLGFTNVLLLDIPDVITAISPVPVYDLDTRAYSMFGQVAFDVTDKLQLSAGGRYSSESKQLTGTAAGTPFTILRPKRKFNDFSPEITATFKPSPDFTFYSSYREGFTSGGFNTTPQSLNSPATPTVPISDPSFEQATVRGVEAGLKGYLADRQIRFDLTGYNYKYKGLQLSVFDPQTVSQTTRNAGGAKVRGIELNAFLRPNMLRGLEVRTGIAYNKATYTNFIGGCYGGQTVAQGCNLNPVNPSSPATAGTAENPYNSQDQSGQQITRAPKWSLYGGLSYETNITEGLGAMLAFDANYMGSYFSAVDAGPGSRQDGHWMLNGNLSLFRATDKQWTLSLIGKNLTNKLVAVSGGASPLSGGGTGTTSGTLSDIFASLNAPRSILLQLTVKLAQ